MRSSSHGSLDSRQAGPATTACRPSMADGAVRPAHAVCRMSERSHVSYVSHVSHMRHMPHARRAHRPTDARGDSPGPNRARPPSDLSLVARGNPPPREPHEQREQHVRDRERPCRQVMVQQPADPALHETLRIRSSSTVSGQSMPSAANAATMPIASRCASRKVRARTQRQPSAAPVQIAASPPTMNSTSSACTTSTISASQVMKSLARAATCRAGRVRASARCPPGSLYRCPRARHPAGRNRSTDRDRR